MTRLHFFLTGVFSGNGSRDMCFSTTVTLHSYYVFILRLRVALHAKFADFF